MTIGIYQAHQRHYEHAQPSADCWLCAGQVAEDAAFAKAEVPR